MTPIKKKKKVLRDGHPRRLSDGRNAWRKMTEEQRIVFVAWLRMEGLDGVLQADRATSTPQMIAQARDSYAGDDIQVDDEAKCAHGEDGAWIQAWVWLEDEPQPPKKKEHQAAQAKVSKTTATEEMIAEVRECYGGDDPDGQSVTDIKIDDEAKCSHSDDGAWIQAWVWLDNARAKCAASK